MHIPQPALFFHYLTQLVHTLSSSGSGYDLWCFPILHMMGVIAELVLHSRPLLTLVKLRRVALWERLSCVAEANEEWASAQPIVPTAAEWRAARDDVEQREWWQRLALQRDGKNKNKSGAAVPLDDDALGSAHSQSSGMSGASSINSELALYPSHAANPRHLSAPVDLASAATAAALVAVRSLVIPADSLPIRHIWLDTAQLLLARGEYSTAQRLVDECARHCVAYEDRSGLAQCRRMQSVVALAQGDPRTALAVPLLCILSSRVLVVLTRLFCAVCLVESGSIGRKTTREMLCFGLREFSAWWLRYPHLKHLLLHLE
jgi:hypothetical protein